MMKYRQYLVFVVLIQISLGGFSQKTENINQSFGLNSYTLSLNQSHIKADFGSNIGKGIDSLEGFPIKYKSSKYAHEAFNADTVITYPLKMWQKYEDQYNHCQVVVIQKNTRGLVCLYCFYNDRRKRKLNRYLKSLEGMFWYRDPKDYIEVIEPPKSDSIIHIIPRKKKNLIQ